MINMPLIKVKDKTGRVHVVGTNSHDMLYINEDGHIQYRNLQCCDGTGKDGFYEFVGMEDEYYGPLIEFVSVEELQLQKILEEFLEEYTTEEYATKRAEIRSRLIEILEEPEDELETEIKNKHMKILQDSLDDFDWEDD